jgi:hypothetical protein
METIPGTRVRDRLLVLLRSERVRGDGNSRSRGRRCPDGRRSFPEKRGRDGERRERREKENGPEGLRYIAGVGTGATAD